MSHPFIDTHTHAHFAAFGADWREVIQRALDQGVWVVNVGTQIDTSRRAIEVAHEFPEGVYAVVGLHPTHTDASHHDEQELGGGEAAQSFTSRGERFDPAAYRALALDPRVVAIGECGLDYYRLSEETKEKQRIAFEAQIQLAHEVQKPLMIHCREAFPDLISILHSSSSILHTPPGIIHFFSGTKDHARELLEMGFAFTFGGAITFPPKKTESRNAYDELIEYIPLDRMLSETDAPYVAPVPYRGKRNEPAYVVEVVRRLAQIKGISVDQVRDAIFENANRILRVG